MADLARGGALIVVAAIANSSFTLPMKRMPRWQWENVWLLWSLFALVLLPFVAAIVTVPQLFAGYGEVDASTLLRVAAFGAAWGIAQVLFGLSVAQIGVALTFSIVLGTSAAVGTIIPFVRLHPDLLHTSTGLLVCLGVGLVAVGMVLCALAGRLRERQQGNAAVTAAAPPSRSITSGLLLAALSGLCASFMNLGLSFAAPVLAMAQRHGAAPFWQLNAVWLPLLLGGFLPNLVYTVYLLATRRSGSNFRASGTSPYWLLCVLMAALWFGSSLLFGVASFYLGSLSTVLGWPVFMSLIVLCASFLGWRTGEWRGATGKPLRLQLGGLALLVVAIILFSRAGS